MSNGRTANKRIWILRGLILLLIICAVIVLALLAGHLADDRQNAQLANSQQIFDKSAENVVIDEEKQITVNGKHYKLKEELETVLVMGVDDSDVQQDTETFLNSNQADFLLLIVVDHSTKSYTSVALNRDTMTKVPVLGVDGFFVEWKEEQLALAHTYGSGLRDSCENTVWAVSELLYQVPIEHYTALSMPAIGLANDAVGGVTVTIDDDFGDTDPTLVKGETIKLNAEQAEHFVRSRKGVSDQTNLNRMSRQKTYMSAWHKLALEEINKDSSFILTLLTLVSDYMVSDMTINELSDFANFMSEYTDNGVIDTKGEAVKGEEYMEYYVDEQDLQQIVLNLFYDQVEQ